MLKPLPIYVKIIKTSKKEFFHGFTAAETLCGEQLIVFPGAESEINQVVKDRYGVEAEPDMPAYELLELAGRKRGLLMSGGVVNTERMAKVLLDEYRGGKLGRFTLELPEDIK